MASGLHLTLHLIRETNDAPITFSLAKHVQHVVEHVCYRGNVSLRVCVQWLCYSGIHVSTLSRNSPLSSWVLGSILRLSILLLLLLPIMLLLSILGWLGLSVLVLALPLRLPILLLLSHHVLRLHEGKLHALLVFLHLSYLSLHLCLFLLDLADLVLRLWIRTLFTSAAALEHIHLQGLSLAVDILLPLGRVLNALLQL